MPVTKFQLLYYAKWSGIDIYLPYRPEYGKQLNPWVVSRSVRRIAEVVDFPPLTLAYPYYPTKKCQVIVAMYSNYNWKQEKLVAEDEENVLDMVRQELDMEFGNVEAEARWWFDAQDPWQPGQLDV